VQLSARCQNRLGFLFQNLATGACFRPRRAVGSLNVCHEVEAALPPMEERFSLANYFALFICSLASDP
jgi:hypothetical protein